MENSMAVSKIIKNRIIIWFSNSISGYIHKGIEARAQTDIYTPVFIAALFTIVKRWKQAKYPLIDKWINKMWYTYNRILFNIKKEENSDSGYNIDEQ